MDYYSKINYINQYMISKRDVMESLERYIEHCKETQEEGWSENKRVVILEMLQKFAACISDMRFPEMTSSAWFYEYRWKADGIVLELLHCDNAEFDDDDELISMDSSECITLAEVKCAYLTVEDYAEKYDVTVTAVRQWIRRGKLRCAVKMGRDWLIPELADRPQRGYEPASYTWNYLPDPLKKEFPFLQQCFEVHITRNDTEKAMFDVLLMNRYGKALEKIRMQVKEREKLELALISAPEVKAEEWYQNIMFVPNKDTRYYLLGGKIMREDEFKKYREMLKILQENNMEISTSNSFYDEDGMYIWQFSADLVRNNYDENNNGEVVREEAATLEYGIVIPAEMMFMSREECGYVSAADLCDSMSGDIISAYSAVAECRTGIREEIIKELELPEEAAYESSILYIQNIEARKKEDLKLFLDVFDFVCEGMPVKDCRLAVCLMNWQEESEKAKIFLECGWKIRSIDTSAVLAYRKM